MANKDHLSKLNKGVIIWNKWRKEEPHVEIDLTGADLTDWNLDGVNLCNADLHGAKLKRTSLIKADLDEVHLRDSVLEKANLSNAKLAKAKLMGADLTETRLEHAWLKGANLTWTRFRGAFLDHAHLSEAKITWTNFENAHLNNASLERADIMEANFKGAHLREANLERASLIHTSFESADLSGSRVFGVSAWNLNLSGATETNLIITDVYEDAAVITIDGLEVAQFVYLFLRNEKIRSAIDTIGKKGVLILGRFSKERKVVLDLLREGLRRLNFVPMMFDFEKPTQRGITETIRILAGMSRFIIADITNPRSIPLELQALIPDYMIPFVPIIQEKEKPFAMFQDLKQKYGDWVLDILKYDTAENLLQVLEKSVVKPALEKSQELILKKAEAINYRDGKR